MIQESLGACRIYRKAVTGRAVRPGPPEPRVEALRNPGFTNIKRARSHKEHAAPSNQCSLPELHPRSGLEMLKERQNKGRYPRYNLWKSRPNSILRSFRATRFDMTFPGFRKASTLGVCRIYRKAVTDPTRGQSPCAST